MLDDAAIDAQPVPRLDGRMIRILCVAQGVLSIGWLAMTPSVVKHGYLSAAAGERLWLAFWIAGLVSAVVAFSLRLPARLTMLAWNLLLFGTALYAAYKANGAADGRPSMLDVPAWGTLEPAWLEVSASTAVYFGVIAAAMFIEARRNGRNGPDPRMRPLLVQAAMIFLLMAGVLARIGFSAWQQLAH